METRPEKQVTHGELMHLNWLSMLSDMKNSNTWVGHDADQFYLFKLPANSVPTPFARSTLDMTLLIPNTQHPLGNNTDLIFCVPVTYDKWNKWKALSEAHSKVTKDDTKISYMDRIEAGTLRTIVMLPEDSHTDEDVLGSIAWLRMVEGVRCRIYIVRACHSPPSKAAVMNAVIGADPDTVMEIEE